MTDKDPSTKEARAKRLRYLRQSLRLSMPKLATLCEVAPSSVQNWEYARFGGLTEKGAKFLIKGLKKDSITVTPEWLLYGIGAKPTLPFSKHSPTRIIEETVIAEELALFKKNHGNAVNFIISDDAMTPVYLPGDHVAGVYYSGKQIDKTVGLPCIVQTTGGNQFVRTITNGDHPNTYHLISENTNSTTSAPVEKNITLMSAAPILWIRRRNPVK